MKIRIPNTEGTFDLKASGLGVSIVTLEVGDFFTICPDRGDEYNPSYFEVSFVGGTLRLPLGNIVVRLIGDGKTNEKPS